MKRTRSQTKSDFNSDDQKSQISFRSKKIPRHTFKNKEPNQIPTITANPLSSETEIQAALTHLRAADPLLSPCIDSFPPPQLSHHLTPFFSLIRNIISQQLSNKASASIESRFVSLCGSHASVHPDVVLSLSAQQLRLVGISGPKASYLNDLSTKYVDGVLTDSLILEMDDETLFNKLTSVKGIGPWSVHMFMIFTLHRPDVLPVGDLVVRRGVQKLYGLKGLPSPPQMECLCDKWKPYRSVGSWYMYRLVEAKGVF